MSKSGKICFGMTLHNNVRFVTSALESILAQTHEDFYLVVVDDCSSDGTGDIAALRAEQDSRVSFYRNPVRLGMIETWRKAFLLADKLHRPDYFAWASDHDLWDTSWLDAHISAFKEDPDLVLVYPRSDKIAEDGVIIGEATGSFQTVGLPKEKRVPKACKEMSGAGNMIYGLFRAEELRRAGIFPRCCLPDRLLLLQLSLRGTFKQLDQKLWTRRYFGRALSYEEVIERQKWALFADGESPYHAYFPILSHGLILVSDLALFPPDGNYSNAKWGIKMASLHLFRKRAFLRKELLLWLANLFR